MRRRMEGRSERHRKFGRNAMRTHVKNMPRNPMRGGIRL